tara:strand:- start:255 stop:1223 length:969 start_codon:yes stop_codon:yes gene_type:complete
MKSKVTVIIPFLNNSNVEALNFLIIKIFKGRDFPDEILIIYSGHARLNLSSFVIKLALKKKTIINKFYRKKMYPGEARNLGIDLSKNSVLGFLDLNTIPDNNWLRTAQRKLKNNILVCWGQTFYDAKKYRAKIIRASTMGSNLHRTIPGTIINKKIINICGKFIENVRAGEDGDWAQRVDLHKIKTLTNSNWVVYKGLDELNYFSTIKKWFIYYCHSKKLSHLLFQKNFYFWVFSLILIFISYNWNGIVAGWDTTSPKYIPNITKIIASLFLFSYVFLRGILIPIKKRTKLLFLLPFNFLGIFLFSFFLDAAKILAFFNFKK